MKQSHYLEYQHKLKPGLPYSNEYVIYIAKKIITMNHHLPSSTAVLTHKGYIEAVGCVQDIKRSLTSKGISFRVDTSFEENIIYPGFIEAHMHPMLLGTYIEYPYVGYYDIHAPDGSIIQGSHTLTDCVNVLKKAFQTFKQDSNAWFNGWGFDFMLVENNLMLERKHLDQVSTDVPIVIMHMSGHLFSLNTKAMELVGVLHDKDDPFIFKDKNGEPIGVIGEMENLIKILKAGGLNIAGNPQKKERSLHNAVQIAHRNGCTTISDLYVGLPSTIEEHMAPYQYWSDQETCPMRFVLYPASVSIPNYSMDYIYALKAKDTDRVSIGKIKFVADGSIQGYTAHLLNKTYYDGTPNVPLELPIEKLEEQLTTAHKAGISCSIHTNGDGATEAVISVLERIQQAYPMPDIRHSLEHNQMVSDNQLYRMQQADISCNIFVNHVYYWGDAHAKFTMGPFDVKRLDPTRSAVEKGVHFSLHSDSPITEVNPLFSAWVAVNRISSSGKVYGKDQCLTINEAMYAITMGSAYLLQQDHMKGSIEPGKLADFTVLKEEITEQNKKTFKDIPIIATIIGGKIFAV